MNRMAFLMLLQALLIGVFSWAGYGAAATPQSGQYATTPPAGQNIPPPMPYGAYPGRTPYGQDRRFSSPVGVATPGWPLPRVVPESSRVGIQTRPIRVLFVASDHVSDAKLRKLKALAADAGMVLDYKHLRKLPKDVRLSDVVGQADLVVFDSVNAGEAKTRFAHFAPEVAVLSKRSRFLAIRWPEGAGLRSGLTEEQAQRLHDYYWHGGQENFRRLMVYISRDIFGLGGGEVESPILYPNRGIYHPDYAGRVFSGIDAYLDWQAKRGLAAPRAVIGISLHRELLSGDLTRLADGLVREIEARGEIPLVFYYSTDKEALDYVDWLQREGKPIVDVLINTRVIHWAEKRHQEFERLGVPVIHAMHYSGSEDEWRQDTSGVPANLIPFYYTLSEMAGVSDPITVSADAGDGVGHTLIAEQIKLLVAKAQRLAQLRSLSNATKRVAILYYNYPPGERSASASFLNVPRSLETIFAALRAEGYQADELKEQRFIDAVADMQRPLYRDVSPAALVAEGLAQTLSVRRYHAWFDTLPSSVRIPIIEHWGEPEDHFMVAEIDGEPRFVIPMLSSGNLRVLPQPPRGDKREREKSIYHSKSVMVNHYYLAVYLYLRQEFGADALVHLGTHGSHEWLPGKERGLWAFEPGNLTAGDVPVVYPYIVDDVGEALQAKRRGRAVTVSHMTPPFAPSGLYRELTEVHELMHQYGELDQGLVRERTKQRLIELTRNLNLLEDMGWDDGRVADRFNYFIADLHDYLHELGTENQPLGLHTWGLSPEPRLLVSTLLQILGPEFTERLREHGMDASAHVHHPGEGHDHGHVDSTVQSPSSNTLSLGERVQEEGGTEPLYVDSSSSNGVALESLPGFHLIQHYALEGEAFGDDFPEALKPLLERARDIYQRIVGNKEMSSLLAALAGRYVSPSTGGDPIRNDESLPTGRNLYGFDPSRVPTKAAWEAGRELVDGMIQDHRQRHGRYPEKMAFSLWSIETMRHYGVLESQALYAMGVRPVWAESGRVTGTEIIPYAELKRPRIDVVLSATGLYRDAFPGVMKLIAEGIDKVARLKEEHNFVYRHTQRLRGELQAQGLATEDVDYFSTARIFSNASGTYGTGLAAGTLASDTWDDDSRLAEMYLDRMGHVFGADENRWGEKLSGVDLYARNLSGTDIALFSRSSNLYGLLTSDDPFQYLGGLSLAVRHLDGRSPEMYISNLRNPNESKIEPLGRFLSKELRARYLHPRWITEMQEEGYSGTLAVLDTVNNFWGWQVVDPQNVRADQWQAFYEVYVKDKYELDLREWFETHNAEALAQLAERMLEAIRKNYWQADEATVRELVTLYDYLRDRYAVFTENKRFEDFVDQRMAGYGLDTVAAPLESTDPVPQVTPHTAVPQQVQGQKLEQVERSPKQYWDWVWMILLLLAAAAAGFLRQSVDFFPAVSNIGLSVLRR